MTETITRDEYRRLVPHQYAGTKRTLANPDTWPATHWVMRGGPKGTALVPVNVESVAAYNRRTNPDN